MARPTIMTKDILGKLEAAFAVGASDKEACFYADINPDTLYEYQKRHLEFTERKEALKQKPVLQARQTVVKALETDPALAMKYLERKRRQEFATRSELTGADGEKLMRGMSEEDIDAVLARAELEAAERAKQASSTSQAI